MPTSEPPATYWPLLWPGIVLVIAALVGGVEFWWFAEWTDEWFTARPWRGRSIAALGIVVSLGFAVLLCFPAWSHVASGHITTQDVGFLCFALGLASVFLWAELVKLRQAERSGTRRRDLVGQLQKAKDAAQTAEQQEFFYRWVSECFLRAVGEKASRVQDLARKGKRIRIDNAHGQDELRAALTALKVAMAPRQQIVVLVQVVYTIYRQLLMRVNDKAKIRVVYFVAEGRRLTLSFAWNGVTEDCVKSLPEKAKEKFKLSGADKCLAVSAAKKGNLVIVQDAVAADRDANHPFKFCYPEQANHLASLIVMPMKDHGSFHRHVVCVDTDERNFFNEEQRIQHEFIRDQLEKRLFVEVGFAQLLA